MAQDVDLLLDRCRTGDDTAWRMLRRDYQRLAVAACIRTGLHPTLCADAVQETFILLYRAINDIRNAHGLTRWISTTASRLAGRQLTRMSRSIQLTEWAGATYDIESDIVEHLLAEDCRDQI